MKIIFWISLFIIFYTFIGYGILLYFIVIIRRIIKRKKTVELNIENLPTLTFVVAAYNEENFIEEKIQNSLALLYPSKRIEYLFVTDGSSDETPSIVSKYEQVKLMHTPERKGKINAMHRAMKQIKTDVVVFSDANTFLNKDALVNIARHYIDERIGAVAGEKKIQVDELSDATAGEGFYWKYESALKKWDSELHSVVGAAGELFSIRTDLYEAVPPDTVLDDFMISMLIAKKGFRIVYEPQAYATESASANIAEELKRKIRIAAGGVQSILRLKNLFNPVKNPVLTFQYISHRVLRWTVTPFLMILSLLLNVMIVLQNKDLIYDILLAAQIAFYIMALLGWVVEKNRLRIKILFIPYYFCLMNYAVIAGIFRYIFSAQTVMWEKAKRK